MYQPTMDEEAQADMPATENDDTEVKIRPLERIKLHPKVPPEESTYGKPHPTRSWILQDGRDPPEKGSEHRAKYKIPQKPPPNEGTVPTLIGIF